jgi:hypothetical protein
MAEIDISKLTEAQLPELKAAMDRLPPEPVPKSEWVPFDPMAKMLSQNTEWMRDMVKAPGVDAAMRAELAERRRPQAAVSRSDVAGKQAEIDRLEKQRGGG